MTDCSDLLRLGQNKKGIYNLDYAATGREDQFTPKFCEQDGWEVILNRGQFGTIVVRSPSNLMTAGEMCIRALILGL